MGMKVEQRAFVMHPYYQDAHGLTLYNGDALAVLPTLAANSVDAVRARVPRRLREPDESPT
jgi:hypothetical protein